MVQFVTHRPPPSTCPGNQISWTANLEGSRGRYRETFVRVPGKRRRGLMQGWSWARTCRASVCHCGARGSGSALQQRILANTWVYYTPSLALRSRAAAIQLTYGAGGAGAFVMKSDSGMAPELAPASISVSCLLPHFHIRAARLPSCANDTIGRFKRGLFAFILGVSSL